VSATENSGSSDRSGSGSEARSPAAGRRAGGARRADPSASLALLWGPQDRPGRSGLTVRAIVDAAISLADADGIDALSMRGVAERLGVGTMSLYTYIPAKPVLIELMIDTVCGQIYADLTEPESQPGDWRTALEYIARKNWDSFLLHPWLLRVLDGRPVLGPNLNRKYEAELRPLDGIGLTDIEMDSVLTLVLTHVLAMARWQVGLTEVRDQSGESDLEWWNNLEPALAALMDPTGFPLASRVGQAAGQHHQSSGDPAHELNFGLGLILDGIADLIERGAGAGAS
jgi:AcrR family transcriptional regulator